MKQTEKRRWFILGAGGLVVLAIWLILYWLFANGTAFAVKVNWNIWLPGGYHEVHGYSTESFHGDGVRYHVLDYTKGKEGKVGEGKKGRLDALFDQAGYPTAQEVETVLTWLQSVQTPEEVVPDFSACKVLYRSQEDGSRLYLFWNREAGRVYVAEAFQ